VGFGVLEGLGVIEGSGVLVGTKVGVSVGKACSVWAMAVCISPCEGVDGAQADNITTTIKVKKIFFMIPSHLLNDS
jgi:hypothetical protein